MRSFNYTHKYKTDSCACAVLALPSQAGRNTQKYNIEESDLDILVYSMETIGMRIWKMVVFADFLSGNPCFILTHAGMLMQCHEAKVIVKPKSDVQSPKVRTKRTLADSKNTLM